MPRFLNFLITAVLFIIVSPIFAHSEIYEETMDRPYGHAQYSDGYTEDDTDQIKETVWPSFFSRRSYNVYLPRGETDNMPYKRPAVLLLHGAGRTGASLVERWKDISNDEDVILIGPHVSGRWNVREATTFIPALLDDAIEKYNIDPKRIYVFGHSMGAVFTLSLAPIQSEKFAAAGVHAGIFYSDNAAELLKDAKRDIPLIMINGTHDKGFPLDKVKRAANAYDRYGHEVELYILERHGHWYYDIAPDINEMAWDFFEDYKLD